MNIYHLTLRKTREKYLKFKKRLEKSISSGEFQTLSRRKKNQLISRVEKFRSRLEGTAAVKKGVAVAGAMALIPGLAMAQDPALRFEASDFLLNPFGTNQQIEIVNIDSDSDMEVLISTNSRGFIFDKNENGDFESRYQSSLTNMDEEFWVGDVDGDSDNDIVFQKNDYFYLAFNDGDGNFQITDQEFEYSSVFISGAIAGYCCPDDVDLVDYDSDGDLDLVIANGSGNVIHFDNNGAGYFASSSSLNVATGGIRDVEFADLDGDGDMDVIFNQDSSNPGSNVRVKENTAGPSATPAFAGVDVGILTDDYNSFEQITVMDMDGDTDLDIFTVDNAGTIGYVHSLFDNQSFQGNDFTFNGVTVTGLATEPINDVAVADFDGDGNDDLLLSFTSDSKVGIFNGSSFVATSRSLNGEIGDAAQAFSSVAAGDLDQDGLNDIVGVTTTLDSRIYYDRSAPFISAIVGDVIIDENTPAGVFATLTLTDFHDDPISASLGGDDAGLFSLNATTGDLSTNQSFDWENSGSDLDLNLTLGDGIKNRTEVLNVRINNVKELGQGYLDPEGITLLITEQNKTNFLSGDIDIDGDDDLIIGDNSGSRLDLLLNSGVGLVNSPSDPYASFRDAVFTDFDSDGDLDLFMVRSSQIDAIKNDGLDFDKYYFSGGIISNQSFGVIAGDFDTDGLEDVAIISSTGDYFYFRNFELSADNNTLNLEQELPFKESGGGGYLSSYGNIVDLAIADFDGDDNDDLLVVIEDEGMNPGTDVLFSGDGSTFSTTPSPFTALQADNGYNRIEIEDLNGDGAIDIVAFRSNGTNIDIDITLNDGTGSFTVSQTFATSGVNDASGDELTDLLFADMDGDGAVDIISSTNNGTGGYELQMFRNDGSGSFSLTQTISNFDGVDIELIDIDNDDDNDVMVREIGDNSEVFKAYLNTNVAASDISLSATTFDEHIPEDSQVATFTVTDANPQDTHVLYLAEGDGTNDEHNNFFAINGNSLVITRDVRAEDFPTLNILVVADDGQNLFEQALVLTVNDVNQAPTAIALSAEAFDENVLPGSSVSNITVTDPNEGDTHTLSLVEGEGSDDNGSFTIQGNQLVLIESIEFDNTSSLSVRIAADDGREYVEQAFTLSVNQVLGLDDEVKNILGIYPNPGQNEINFNIANDLLGEMNIHVTDLLGRTIHQFESEKSSKNWTRSLDMTGEEAGVYIIEVTIGKMKVTQRWVKQD